MEDKSLTEERHGDARGTASMVELSQTEYNNSSHRTETERKTVSCVVGEEEKSGEEVGARGEAESGGGSRKSEGEENGRERLKRHRIEVAGRVWIPDIWGQEEMLKDWIDCSAFDASLMNSSIMSARNALVGEGRRANSRGLRIENRC